MPSGFKPGMVVADVGAGTGYMSLRMAKRVGPSGKVYSEDVQPEMLHRLRQNAAEAKLDNIQTVLGGEADPKLPPERARLDSAGRCLSRVFAAAENAA